MNKTITKLKVTAFIIAFIEMLAILAVVLFWYFDILGFADIEYIEYYVYAGLSFFLLVDIAILVFGLMRLTRLRQRNDSESASIIGNDLNSAYDFGEIGLLVTDESDSVIWTNELFRNRQIDIIDTNAFELSPALEELARSSVNKTVKATIKERVYEIRYVSPSRLYIFKDVTDYESALSYSRENATVLGIIVIDNFDDVASDTDDSADSVNNARLAITEYCRDFGVLLRRVRSDTYFAVCNRSALQKMENDHFSVLEKVRSRTAKDSVPLTLSIGFAHDFPDIAKLNEMAADALDVAMSRGGDQAVISQHGRSLRFFGGNSAAIENTSKVKVRSFANSLILLMKGSTKIYVMGHQDMDMDALGSCLGIAALGEWCGKETRIVYNSRSTEKKTRLAFQSAFSREAFERLTISPEAAASSADASTLLVVVDVAVPNMTMAPKLLDKAPKVIVIDHHRKAAEHIERPVLSYIETSASSATELITEMIRYATANPKIYVKPSYATIMLSGIFLDSNYFKSKSTGMRTFEAAEILKEYGADNAMADDYLKDDYEEYHLITRIISTIKTHSYGVVYCTYSDKEVIERSTLGKVANQLMQLKGINACFVIGKTDEKSIRISARSNGTINVQLLMEKMHGGGHLTMAAAVFQNTTAEKVEASLIDILNEYLDSARKDAPGKTE